MMGSWELAQVVECLPYKYETPIPSTHVKAGKPETGASLGLATYHSSLIGVLQIYRETVSQKIRGRIIEKDVGC